MEEYLQRLRNYLTRGELTAVDARDGMIGAYLVISRLNQLKGNPAVGLKQDEQGLYKHITGFMNAVFWERGFNYELPKVEQLSEIKMMLDGMTQIYAMPDEFQMALNEICDFLLARASGQPAVMSPSVMDLLDYQGSPEVTLSSSLADSFPEKPRAAELDTDLAPSDNTQEAVIESDNSPEALFEAVFGKSSKAEEIPSLEGDFDISLLEKIESGPDTPQAPAGPLTAEKAEFLQETVEAPLPAPAARLKTPDTAAEESPLAKKKRGRKKAAADSTAAETKAAAKKSKSAKSAMDVTAIEVPEDFMTEEPELARDAAPEALSEPGPESAPVPAPESQLENISLEPDPQPPAPEPEFMGSDPDTLPAPEPEPKPDLDPFAYPLGVKTPPPQARALAEPASPETEQPRFGLKDLHLGLEGEDHPKRKSFSGMKILLPALGLVLGLIVGAGGMYYYGNAQVEKSKKEAEQRNQALQKELQSAEKEAATLKAETEQLRENLEANENAWQKPPAKPDYIKAGQGAIIYWLDEKKSRKYFLYYGKGAKGELAKTQKQPLERNLFFLSQPAKGTWRFMVSALDKEGKETEKGEALSLTFPLKK